MEELSNESKDIINKWLNKIGKTGEQTDADRQT